MALLNARDTISGKEGRAFATINGNQEDLFYIKTLEASVEKTKAEIKTLGKRNTQSKTTGWAGTGSMTIYYMTSVFREMMATYIADGVDTYFDIHIVNEDPQSGAGKQEIILNNVNLNGTTLAMLDVESDALEESVEFTFDNFKIEKAFN